MTEMAFFLVFLGLLSMGASLYLIMEDRKHWWCFLVLAILLVGVGIFVQQQFELGKKKEADRFVDLIKEFVPRKKRSYE